MKTVGNLIDAILGIELLEPKNWGTHISYNNEASAVIVSISGRNCGCESTVIIELRNIFEEIGIGNIPEEIIVSTVAETKEEMLSYQRKSIAHHAGLDKYADAFKCN
jgi:hypothetical protein